MFGINPLMMGGAAGKTVAQFQAHILGRAATLTAGSGVPGNSFPGSFFSTRVGTLSESGVIYGTSSWGDYFENTSSNLSRLVQHGMPSLSAFQSQVSNSGIVLVVLQEVGTSPSAGGSLDRNGYTSLGGIYSPGIKMTELTYWDYGASAAFTMNPFAMTGPTPYVF